VLLLKKAKNILFVLTAPDVFKSPASDTYVIFGEAKIEDMNQENQAKAAKEFKAPVDTKSAAPASQEEDDGEVVDEKGLDGDEIQTIITQAGVSRARAVKALRKSGNLVDAILELSPSQ